MRYPSFQPNAPLPTLDELKARRLECVTYALALGRRLRRMHPMDTTRADWERAMRYWIAQARDAQTKIAEF